MQDLEHGLAVKNSALQFGQVRAVFGLVFDPLAADRTFALLVIALHRDLGDDAALHQLVGQLGVLAVAHVKLADTLHPPAALVRQVVRGDDPADNVRKILRMLEVDLFVDRRHIAAGEFLGREMVAIFIRAGAAENERELRVAGAGLIHCRGAETGQRLGQPDLHRDGRVTSRVRSGRCRISKERKP